MKSPSSMRSRPGLHFLALIGLGCAPIWAVDYFVPQDGPAHAYSAFLMLELLKSPGTVADYVAWNAWTLPNSSGHWLLALLQSVLSPFVATKILATLTYGGLVAAVGYLRLAAVGRDGLPTSLWIGAAIGFNWLWLCGLYNFLLGVIGFAVALGLYLRGDERGREPWRAPRVAGLALLALLVYFSHLVAFGVLAASLIGLAASEPGSRRGRACAGVLLALLPAALLMLVQGASPAGESLFPVWRRLSDPGSIAAWIFQLRTADPFVLISRRAFPFSAITSSALALLTPLLWMLAAAAGLTWGTLAARKEASPSKQPGRSRTLVAICGACALAAIFGPDDFGQSHGTLLRERLALLAAVAFVPLFRSGGAGGVHHAMRTRWVPLCLAGVVLFQTAALWEYAQRTSRDAAEFLALAEGLEGRESLASVIVLDDGKRFHSNPIAQMSNFFGIAQDIVVWDNYELGYRLFPLRARSSSIARFVREFTSVNVFEETAPAQPSAEKLTRLDRCLEENRGRIGTLLLWSRNSQVEAVLGRWFESEPYFERGRGRLYRRRAAPAAPVSEPPRP